MTYQPPPREGGCASHEDGFAWTDGEFRLPARFFPPLDSSSTFTVHPDPHPGTRYLAAARLGTAAC